MNQLPLSSSDSIAGALVGLRSALRRSQQDIAAAATITRGQLSRYETGDEKPSWSSLEPLLHSLGVTPQEFFGLAELVRRAERRLRGELAYPTEPFETVVGRGRPAGNPEDEATRLMAQALFTLARGRRAASNEGK